MNIMVDSSDELRVAERSFSSRLLIGTGKYKDFGFKSVSFSENDWEEESS